MTRNEKIALGVGAGVVLVGGIAFYFATRPSSQQLPPSSPSTPPQIPPPSPSTFELTTTPTPQTPPTPPTPPPAPPTSLSLSDFTAVVAGRRYRVTLDSPTAVDWTQAIQKRALLPTSMKNFAVVSKTPTELVYTADNTVTHRVQNIMFMLGYNTPMRLTEVVDLGASS